MIICFKFVLFKFLNSSSFLKNRLHPNWSVRTLDEYMWPAHNYILVCHFKVPTCRPLPHSICSQKCRPVHPTCLSKLPACRPAHQYIYAISKCRPAYLSTILCNQKVPICLPVCHTRLPKVPTCWPVHHYVCHFNMPTSVQQYIHSNNMWICNVPTTTYMYAISKCRPADLSLTVCAIKKCRPADPTCLSKVLACRPAHQYI